ncbi:MAG: NUDIX domain-containing protein [bacterium]
MADIVKIALLVIEQNKVLLCKKRGLSKLILPGGRIEVGENALECLQREITEELGIYAVLGNVEQVGVYHDIAAVDGYAPLKTLEITLYAGQLIGELTASMEIEELVWFGVDDDVSRLSAILINKIFPDIKDRGLVAW